MALLGAEGRENPELGAGADPCVEGLEQCVHVAPPSDEQHLEVKQKKRKCMDGLLNRCISLVLVGLVSWFGAWC